MFFPDLMNFQSQILTGKGCFVEHNICYELVDVKQNIGTVFFMDSTQMHTVFVEQGECCAWLINEEPGIAPHNPACYSNNDLTKFKFEEHYLPMSKAEVKVALDVYFYGR